MSVNKRFLNYKDMYLSGFANRYLQDFLATVAFEDCSEYLTILFFFLNGIFSTKIP